jgi:GntR family transcriptional regulator
MLILTVRKEKEVMAEVPPAFRPLYQQVKETLLGRLIDSTWLPGMSLPSEQQLAQELGVSQGTVRKALDSMTAEHLLVRAQGRGTFVAEFDDRRILFRFFRLIGDDDSRQFPESSVAALRRRTAEIVQREKLQLAKGERVWCIERTRQLGGRPVVAESIILPVAVFPGLDRIEPIPNNVYSLYVARFGQTVSHVKERLKADLASKQDAAVLECTKGDPLLKIDRVAYSLKGNPIEWRVSRCLTERHHYLSEL